MVKRDQDTKNRASRRRVVRSINDPRYWLDDPNWKPKKDPKSLIPGVDNIWVFAPLTSVLSAAVFWGVWTWTGPDPQSASGMMPLASSTTDTGSSTTDSESATFGLCHEGGGYNCVVDGDTIYYQGTKIRIADIDTPETHEPRCADEARRGAEATQRMHQLVNAGSFSLESINRDEDNYGRKLRIINRGGESLGGVLVDEGLARWYAGGRQPWC